METINNDNIELYLFRYKEGLLDTATAKAVERLLATHPEWQELADLYDPELKLPAGAVLSYADAESLRDGGPKAIRRRKMIPLWVTSAAAACLLFAVAVGLLRTLGGTTQVVDPVVVARQEVNPGTDSVTTPEKQTPYVPIAHTEHFVVAEQSNEEIPVTDPMQVEETLTIIPTDVEPVLAEADPSLDLHQASEEEYDSWLYDEEAKSVYSNRLITYLDDISAEASMETPDYVEPSNCRGDAVRQITGQVTELATKSSEFVANTRRRYQDREARILSDIEQQTENNSFIRNLIASIL